MTRRGEESAAGAHQDGFVLIGVVMFVLALTILGLSLFSLSGYEASFLAHSRDASQAFYDATGGLDRARYMLVTRDRLESVKDTLWYDGPEGVIYARARYADWTGVAADTSGSVNWNRDIDIRVLAVRHGVRSMVESRFHPKSQVDYYKRLITSTGTINFDAGASAHWAQTYLMGEAWLDNHDKSTWYPTPPIGQLPSPVNYDGVPVPDLSPSFWDQRFAMAQEVTPVDANPHTYLLDASGAPDPDKFQYFKTTANPALPSPYNEMSLVQTKDNPTISVIGKVVWMFDKGVNFAYGVNVIGSSPNDILVIMARKGNRSGDTDAAVWFYGGLTSINVRVVIVAGGNVHIEQVGQGGSVNTRVSYLSIFNDGMVETVGPVAPFSQQLIHDPADDVGPQSPIDFLYSKGALPNSNYSQLDRLARVAGTWRQVTESNPD